MAKTFAVYGQYNGQFFRLGLYTHRGKGASVREVSMGFYRRNPNTTGQYFLAPRHRIMGKWVDGERVPMEPREK